MTNKQHFLRILVLSIILCLLVAYYAYQKIYTSPITVSIEKNFVITSNFDFIHEHWKEEKLSQLRTQESYATITATTQFDYFLQLCHWVHQQWEWSEPDPYPLSNALDILADIRAKKTGGFCGQYAYVFADVLKSIGFFDVRYIELWSPTGKSHFSVEVWSDQYEKWIMLDPDQALYYELADSKIPANAYEIRESLLNPAFKVNERPVHAQTPIAHHVTKDVYANFAVSLRSDLLRHTKPLTVQDRFDMFLFYQDQHTQTSAFQQVGDKIPYRHITTRKEDIYYDCNRVRIEYSIDTSLPGVVLEFFTEQSMANFKGFIVSVDQGKTWKYSPYQYLLTGQHDEYEVWVRPVNMFDRHGITTKAYIRFD
ncbi:hypothetical protein U27_06695 [Candidatus Vecturithrix granuli]|uniref:Transglutaminase-like domain-containing protein n=1 Tax=Vecturithrix granuli TaxID=1499967 RepID=A0A081C555_VECG1|nr:hypothetical protein U27_06695 [Candidatus Vecturithrix granuli]